ncbi:TetR family transcriptional regulator C-terminal domain-containing protein [Pararhodobacter aggregans]|uniref:TetR family transcriptional regulator n=1 Tax=Pararhodobacter aggregans TaxID=404875 RepID=A0A2T7UQJ2_9RHOB|nr:TetR family transcriptional regulator C-terminal domain-containing protein [Pararhodobacter aggregans]PTX01802.1 TetR family transcriptional regulator [Pararhodobacter aggregans]PVE47005.1 TetR family transcriptional regulator [Pararhodobacter aggregans]
MTTRIQRRNRRKILDAALDVFSAQGFRGATLDQIAGVAGLSKPNLLYYFDSKEAMHRALLDDLLDVWLEPLRALNPDGNGKAEILAYMRRKLQMSREFPRESRLFANEVLQGAPRLGDQIGGDLKKLVDESAALIRRWIAAGQLAPVDPYHLIFSIWALTQHYADFDAQIRMIRDGADPMEGADAFLETLFERLLKP